MSDYDIDEIEKLMGELSVLDCTASINTVRIALASRYLRLAKAALRAARSVSPMNRIEVDNQISRLRTVERWEFEINDAAARERFIERYGDLDDRGGAA